MTVFTAGYTGRTVAQLLEAAQTLNADVMDIRFSPRSRNPVWSGSRLAESLGDRYRHLRAFGNANYKELEGPGTVLVDAEEGVRAVRSTLESGRNVILLCACKDPAGCHRTDVAALLRSRDIECDELTWP